MPKIVKYHGNVEAIIALLQGKTDEKKLSKEQQFFFDRVIRADDLFRQYQNMTKVSKMLNGQIQKLIEINNWPYSYSERTAMNDIRDAQIIYGTTFKLDREYNVGILMEEIGQAINMAKITKDAKALVQALKVKAYSIKEFLGDSDTLRMEDLEIGGIVITADLKQLNVSPKAERDLQMQLEKLLAKKSQKTIDITEA